MTPACECDRMNQTVGWENKSASGGSGATGYSCYKGMCYPSSHANATEAECKATCTTPPPTPAPANATYYCHYGECRESRFGTQSLPECKVNAV